MFQGYFSRSRWETDYRHGSIYHDAKWPKSSIWILTLPYRTLRYRVIKGPRAWRSRSSRACKFRQPQSVIGTRYQKEAQWASSLALKMFTVGELTISVGKPFQSFTALTESAVLLALQTAAGFWSLKGCVWSRAKAASRPVVDLLLFHTNFHVNIG